MEQAGRQGPHPEIKQLVAADMSGAAGRAISVDAVRILQQRTLEDTLLFGQRRTESASVAILHEDPFDTLVVTLVSKDQVSGQWSIQARASTALGRPPVKPLVGRTLIGGGRIIVGALVSSSNIHALRVVLPDGTAVEDTVSNGSALLFVPLQGPHQAGQARVQVLDSRGAEISSDTHLVDPKHG